MGRLIVLFLVVGAVAMFMLVLNTPPQLIRDSYLYQRYVATPSERTQPEVEPEPVVKRPAARRAVAQATRPVEVTSAAPETPAAGEALAAPRFEGSDRAQARTATDVVSVGNDALIYASNSTNAPVLKVLNKGQIVEVDMEFITPGGKWALVTLPNEQISGFVRTDGLVLMSASRPAPATAMPQSGQ